MPAPVRAILLPAVVALIAACNADDPAAGSAAAVTATTPASSATGPAASAANAPAASAPPAAEQPAAGPPPSSDPSVPGSLLDGKWHSDIDDPDAAAWCAAHAPHQRATWLSNGDPSLAEVFDMVVRDVTFDEKVYDGSVRHVRALSLDMIGRTQRTVDPTNGPTLTTTTFTIGLTTASSSTTMPPAFGPFKLEHTSVCRSVSSAFCSAAEAGGSAIPCASPDSTTGTVEITAIADGFVDGLITWDSPTSRALKFHAPLEGPETTPSPNVCCLK